MSTEKSYSKRFDVSFQKSGASLGRRFYVKVGVAFQDTKTGRIKIKLDTIPIQWDGILTLFPKDDTLDKSSDLS